MLVRRVLDCARTIITSEGLEALTTNRIAEMTGISPGSLYRYFPNKKAISLAVVERELERLGAVIVPTDAVIFDTQAALRRSLEIVTSSAAVFRELLHILDEGHQRGIINNLEQRLGRGFRDRLMLSGIPIRHVNVEGALYIVVESITHLWREFILQKTPFSDHAELADLSADLLRRFLFQDDRASPE